MGHSKKILQKLGYSEHVKINGTHVILNFWMAYQNVEIIAVFQ